MVNLSVVLRFDNVVPTCIVCVIRKIYTKLSPWHVAPRAGTLHKGHKGQGTCPAWMNFKIVSTSITCTHSSRAVYYAIDLLVPIEQDFHSHQGS